MRTIGKHHPDGRVSNYTALCAYCGVRYYRSELKKDMSGNLVCPDEGNGRSMLALDTMVAAQSAWRGNQQGVKRDGTDDETQESPPTPFNPNPYTSFP